jgi:UPF0755 protein
MKKFVFLFVLALLAAGAGAYVLDQRAHTPFQGFTASEQFVEIPLGASTRTIGGSLVAAGVVPDSWTYRAALWLSGDARRLKAGEYRFDRPLTPLDVIGKIARGEVYVIALTFPEGQTIADMSKIFESRGLGPAASFAAAARDDSIVEDVDPGAKTLEGYLFPSTYMVPRKTGAADLVRLMAGQFRKKLTPDLQSAADDRGLTVRQLVTLASIVEKETARPDERPLVASVYANRLRIGMGLQCDPTVIYALTLAGRYTGNLKRDDLEFDSPYNTYRYRGLPPGPIASPGKESLEAAAHPADTEFLYFVSRNDGSHAFARTLEEHNRNVDKYQRSPHLSLVRKTSK